MNILEKRPTKIIALTIAVAMILTMSLTYSLVYAANGSTDVKYTVDKASASIGDGKTFEKIQDAVNAVSIAAVSGPTNFEIALADGEYNEHVQICQQADKNIVLKAKNDKKAVMKNTITIDGMGKYNGNDTLLIEGLYFDFTEPATNQNCIETNRIGRANGYVYAHNITINNCDFYGDYDKTPGTSVVPFQLANAGSRNIVMTDCYAENTHSLAQLKALGPGVDDPDNPPSSGATFRNCVTKNCKGGINFNGNGTLTVDTCDIRVDGYAIRGGTSDFSPSDKTGSIKVINSKLSGTFRDIDEATIILRGNAPATINVSGSELACKNGAVIRDTTDGSYPLNMTLNDNYWGNNGLPDNAVSSVKTNPDTKISIDNYRTHLTLDANTGAFSDGKTTKSAIGIVTTSDNKMSIVSSELPIKTGQIFDGWYTEANGGTTVNATGNNGLTGDAILYAHWAQKDQGTTPSDKPGTDNGSVLGEKADPGADNDSKVLGEKADGSKESKTSDSGMPAVWILLGIACILVLTMIYRKKSYSDKQ